MANSRVSGVPVVDQEGRVVGVITEKDFLVHMTTRERRNFMEVVAECLKGTGCLAAPIRARNAGDVMIPFCFLRSEAGRVPPKRSQVLRS